MGAPRLAWSIWGVSLGAALAAIALDVAADRPDVGWYVFLVAAVLLYGTVGALITSRQPGNRVGLIFSWIALLAGLGNAAGSYATLAADRGLPFLAAATWFAQTGFAAMIGPLAFLFLIFPTGSPPSRRWGWLLRVMLVAYAVTIVLFALTPGRMQAGFAELHSRVLNPLGLPATWKPQIQALTTVAGAIVFIGAIASIASLIQRYRRASQQERQQIRWLAWLGGFTAAYVVVMFILEATRVLPQEGFWSSASFIVLLVLIFVGIPITCAIAILRHGLWDLDVVVRKTVQYGVLVGGFTLVAGAILAAVPVSVIGVGADVGGVVPVLLGAVIAVAFVLARGRAQRWADRLVYGRRSTPYEVLSDFADRVGETYSMDDVLPRMAQIVGEATGARAARVWLRVDGSMRPEATWPEGAPAAPAVLSAGDALPDFGGDHAFEIRHRGELLGALTLTEAADDPMNPTKTKLAKDVAAQAGLVLRNVRLIEELRESRRRIVAAQDARAKRLERDIHDGAQQQLVSLAVKLRLASGLVDRDPAKARQLLEELGSETTETLEDLRDLARGIYPPLLADQGLAAALEAQARKSPVPVRIEPDGVGRYRPEVESAVYFSCLEALNNVAKYADASSVTVRLRHGDGSLRFEVADDGRGFDASATGYGTGLQGMKDRLDAIGGTFEVRTAPGAGTVVAGRLPVTDDLR